MAEPVIELPSIVMKPVVVSIVTIVSISIVLSVISR